MKIYALIKQWYTEWIKMHSLTSGSKSTLQYKKNIPQECVSLVAWFQSYGHLKIKKMLELQHNLTQTSTSLHVAIISLFVPFEVSNQWRRWMHFDWNHRYASDTWLNLWHWTWCIPLCPKNTASLNSRFKHFFLPLIHGLGKTANLMCHLKTAGNRKMC